MRRRRLRLGRRRCRRALRPVGEAGELLVGYPMTGVSTSQATESLRIQLRTYLGACITNPESVFVLPNVSFEGLCSDPAQCDITASGGTFSSAEPDIKTGVYEGVAAHTGGQSSASGVTGRTSGMACTAALPVVSRGIVVHHGAMYKDGKLLVTNQGHLGELDSPSGVSRMWGDRVFGTTPDPKGRC